MRQLSPGQKPCDTLLTSEAPLLFAVFLDWQLTGEHESFQGRLEDSIAVATNLRSMIFVTIVSCVRWCVCVFDPKYFGASLRGNRKDASNV